MKIEWKNLIITILIIMVLTGGSIIGYIFFTNYSNNLQYQSYVLGANENTIRIVQTIQDELSIPTFQVDETTNETKLVWVELERICGGNKQ